MHIIDTLSRHLSTFSRIVLAGMPEPTTALKKRAPSICNLILCALHKTATRLMYSNGRILPPNHKHVRNTAKTTLKKNTRSTFDSTTNRWDFAYFRERPLRCEGSGDHLKEGFNCCGSFTVWLRQTNADPTLDLLNVKGACDKSNAFMEGKW